MKIIVPATSANLGAGFDSIGLAVNLYLTIELLEESAAWLIEHDLGAEIPTDETNLLVKTAQEISVKFDRKILPHHIKMTSEIPLARGLGSSSSVIVAGIELANQLCHLDLDKAQKLQLATEIEGHPDNVAPAIYGNLVVAATIDGQTSAVPVTFPAWPLLAFVPDYQLKTSASRAVLPETLPFKTAVKANAIGNMLTASLLTGNRVLAFKFLEMDCLHEQYRAKLVKEFGQIRALCQEILGETAVYLSGAGPTVMSVMTKAQTLNELRTALLAAPLSGQILELEIDRQGLRLEN